MNRSVGGEAGSGHGGPWLIVAVAVSCVALLGGCQSARAVSGSIRHSGQPVDRPDRRHVVPVASTSGAAAVHPVGQIASGWLAAERSFESAARSADPDQPDLAATTVAPLLPVVTSYLERMQATGQIAVGPEADLGTPTVSLVSPRLATVADCAYDAEISEVRATGLPAAGVAGEAGYERFSSVMERTSTGWELAEQTVVGVTSCTGT